MRYDPAFYVAKQKVTNFYQNELEKKNVHSTNVDKPSLKISLAITRHLTNNPLLMEQEYPSLSSFEKEIKLRLRDGTK